MDFYWTSIPSIIIAVLFIYSLLLFIKMARRVTRAAELYLEINEPKRNVKDSTKDSP